MLIKKKTGIQSARSSLKAWEAHQKDQNPNFFQEYMSRREFFEKGLAGVTSTLFMPSLLSLLLRSKEAQAADYKQIASFIITLQGGDSWGSEFVLSDANGNLTLTAAAHQQLSGGLQTTLTESNPISRQFGVGLWTRGLLYNAIAGTPLPQEGNGIQITPASEKVRDNLKITAYQHSRTDDDTNRNPNVPSHLISASALMGSNTLPLVKAFQNNNNSNSGGNGRPTIELAGFKPGSGNTLTDLANLTSLKVGALNSYSESEVRSLSRTIASFADKQRNSPRMGGQLKLVETSKEASDNLQKLVENPVVTNPLSDLNIVQAFGLTNATLAPAQTIAANVMLVLNGVAPLLVHTMAGYDHHSQPSSRPLANLPGMSGPSSNTGLAWRETLHPNLIDRTIRILNAAASKGVSAQVTWVTDGSVRFSSGPNNDLFASTGEGGQTGHTALTFHYSDPSNPLPPLRRFYLGGFDPNTGGAITNTTQNILARGPEYEGLAIYASYLGARGALTYDQINELLPSTFKGDRALINNLLAMNMYKV